MAELRGWTRLCALQLEYSLVERSIEREYVPAALELGMGICGWSPLASGFLAGKYRQTEGGAEGEGRLQIVRGSGNPVFDKFTDRNWRILDALLEVSRALDRPPAQVAVSWITRRPGAELDDRGREPALPARGQPRGAGAGGPPELSRRLEEASRPELGYPYLFFRSELQGMMTGGTIVRREPPWFRG
jgi:hypothetical protein